MDVHDHLSTLDDSKTAWILKVRVSRIWVSRSSTNGEVVSNSMILLDCLVSQRIYRHTFFYLPYNLRRPCHLLSDLLSHLKNLRTTTFMRLQGLKSGNNITISFSKEGCTKSLIFVFVRQLTPTSQCKTRGWYLFCLQQSSIYMRMITWWYHFTSLN